ncbi:MAG: prephenate dehydratase [Candidatus Dojkabacteria bacterium]
MKDLNISIQGNLGSYSHIAANSIFGKDIELLERTDFTDVFEDLKENRADYIVVPFENSTHGSVFQNYDNISKYGFTIIGEVYLRINFHMIVHPGTKLEDITTIYSHPVGLNQIRAFLHENTNIKDIEFDDTAGSVKMIKEKRLKDSAAAAGRLAAEIYGMEILKENIHENQKNFTRFFVLSKEGKMPEELKGKKSNKTSIQFLLGDEPGSLYKSLRTFADRDIALTKIESRPILHTDWEYRFYVDVMSGIQEDKMKNALFELKSYVKELKILGSYEKGKYIET